MLIKYFTNIMPLTPEEIKGIEDSMSVQSYPKGTLLLCEGQVAQEAYFVLGGCVRQYYLVDGEERTDHFFTEGQWVLSLQSFTQKTPANHFWVCNEDTTLVIGNGQKESDLYSRFPKFETIARKVMEKVLAEQQQYMASYLTETPEGRYQRISEERPELLQRVPQYQLASYIGVKPESLSRIRKRIADKKA